MPEVEAANVHRGSDAGVIDRDDGEPGPFGLVEGAENPGPGQRHPVTVGRAASFYNEERLPSDHEQAPVPEIGMETHLAARSTPGQGRCCSVLLGPVVIGDGRWLWLAASRGRLPRYPEFGAKPPQTLKRLGITPRQKEGGCVGISVGERGSEELYQAWYSRLPRNRLKPGIATRGLRRSGRIRARFRMH